MILIDNLKFACSECIRGHRSTMCRHHMRPLLQVRSKGRPNLIFPYGNKNYRVAVFAEEIDEKADESENCKTTPVVILKASNKHVIDYTNGQIMGPYDEAGEKSRSPLVQSESFVNSSTCCSTTSAKAQKNCKCNQKKVSRNKIIRSFLTKKMAHSKVQQDSHSSVSLKSSSGGCCGSKKSEVKIEAKTKGCGPNFDAQPIAAQAAVQKGSCCGSSKVKREIPYVESVEKDVPNGQMPSRPTPLDTSGYAAAYFSQEITNFPIYRMAEPQPQPQPQQYASTQLLHAQNTSEMTANMNTNGNTPSASSMANSMTHPMTSSMTNSMTNTMANTMGKTMTNPMSNSTEQGYFQVISVPSCSIPGTCRCSTDCSCPTCVVHNNAANKSEDPLSFFSNDQQYDTNLILKSESQMQTGSYSSTSRYAHELSRDMVSQFNYRAPLSAFEMNSNPNSHTPMPSLLSQLQMELENASQGLQQQSIQEPQPDTNPCTCPDNACFCMNCEAHGIIDGHRLEDLFRPRSDFTNVFGQQWS